MSLLEDQQKPTSQVSSGLISYPDAATPVAIATTERAAQREADTQAAQTQIDLRTQEAQRQADAHSDAVANLKLSLSSAYAKDMPPEEAAKYERLSKATGFDPALISTNPDVKAHSERLLRLSEIKPDTLAVLYPHTAKLLSNPQTAALSHDDSSALQHLEDAWANTWRSVGSGSLSLGAVALDIAAELGGMAGVLTTEQEAATLYKNDPEGLKRFREQSIPGALDRMARRLQEYSTATINQMPESAKQRYQTLEYATTDMSKSALLSPVRMVGDALQSLPSSAALMLAAYFTKKAASSAASLASVKADELALTGAAKTEFVRQASVRAAERAATVSGAVGEGILGSSMQTLQTAEQISKTDVSKSPVYLALLGQGYSPEAATVKVKADTADQAGIIAGLVDAGVNAAAGKWIAAMFTGKSLGKAIVQGVAVESGTEMVQSGGEQFGVNLAIKKNIDEAQSLTRGVLESMIQGGVIGGLTGGTVAGLSTWVDGKVQAEGQAENAAEFHRSMTALSQAASSAKLRERDPEHFKQFMQSMAGSTDLKDVFIDATTLQEVLAKATPEQQQVFAQEMPQVVAQIAETAGRDGAIAISVEDYATHIAGKELDAAILPHLKGEEAGLTYAQAQEQVKAQTEEMLLEEAKSVLADQKTTEEFQTDAQQVYDTLLGRVEGAKRFSPDVNKKYAALQQAYFVTKAQRLGIKPSELLARFDVQVQAEPTSGVTLDQGRGAMQGLPQVVKVDGKEVTFGPHDVARSTAAAYMEKAGIPYSPPATYSKVDPERAQRIAAAYEAMPHDPTNPEVKAAYDALISETVAQWQAIKATGLKVEFITGKDPYGNPRNAILDVVDNNHLWVFPTAEGFGGTESKVDITGNPLLQVVPGEEISGRPVVANDLFRIVHDYFGHVKEGVGFRADGEENAWRIHSAMFSPLAQRALTTETRGQNSWLNFGPYAEHNKTATGETTQYAPQKTGLLPEWVSSEGLADSQPESSNYGYRARDAARKATLESFAPERIKDLLRATDWAILTAENPNAEQLSPEENAARNAELKADLAGFEHTEVKGKYGGNEETSFIVTGITREQATALSQKYGQQSVLTRDGLVYPDGTVNPARSVASFDTAPEDFYSQVPSTGAFFAVDIDFDRKLDLGEARPGEVTIEGVHFSHSQRSALEGSAYGTGAKGAEAQRLSDPAADPRIKQRISFYVDEGKGVFPEAGVGAFRHETTLTNMYDATSNPLKLKGSGNDFEKAVVDAGFDGYYVKGGFGRRGVAVLLGDATRGVQVDLPVKVLGQDMFQADFADLDTVIYETRIASSKGTTADVPLGNVNSEGLKITNTTPGLRKFWGWFGQSEAVDAEGRPQVMYHGTPATFSTFQLGIESINTNSLGSSWATKRHGIFFADSKTFAEEYAISKTDRSRGEKAGANIMPVYLSVQNPFDFTKGVSVQMEKELEDGGFNTRLLWMSGVRTWELFDDETGEVLVSALKKAGYDSAVIEEEDENGVYRKVFIAFEPTQIKSAIGNRGTFDATNPNILYQTVVPTFYSQLSRAISAAPGKVFGKGENVANWVNANASKLGIKKAEVDAVGLVEWLQTRAKVTKADVVNFVEQNGVQVQDVIMGEDSRKLDFEEVESNDEGFSEMYEAEFEMKDGGKEKVGIAYAPGADAWWGFYRGEMVVEDVSREDAEDAAISAARNDMADSEPGASNTKFSSYQLPGGENYKELLLTLPVKKIRPHAYEVSEGRWATGKGNAIYPSKEMAENYGGMVDAPSFRSSHFDQPNIIAHIRFNERTDADGKRVLFLEEIQSDWGQKGKKEGFESHQEKEWTVRLKDGGAVYRRVGSEAEAMRLAEGAPEFEVVEGVRTVPAKVPSAPFVTDTKAWTALALKRVIRYAADNGFDKVAWTTGEQQAARYDLSKQIGVVVYRPENNTLRAYDVEGNRVIHETVKAEDVEDYIGKEAAKKLLEAPVDSFGEQELKGEGLKVGGEGMKGYYDQIVPQVANDILKKLGGGKVETIDFGTWDGEPLDVPAALDVGEQQGFTITPELRAKVTNEGQALFQKNRGTFNPDTLTISLLKDADLTTFLHETGHFFLEAEAALAADPESTSDDFQKTLNWFGIPDLATWQRMTFEEKRPFHEQYARGFEAYLFEGKAPSAELRSIFASFKQWLLHVYRSLTNLNVELTDEVRGVFDRMLASDEAIFQTEQRHALTAALLQDMTPSEKAAYLALDGDASDDAMLELERRSMRDMQWLSNAKAKILKDIQKEAAGKRKEVRDQVYAEVMAEPINQARTFLRKGEMADPTTGDLVKAEKGFRLNTTVLAEMYPETMLARPDLTKLRGMTSAEGLDPDVVATIFGFPSGDALVRSLIAEESPSEKIKGLTDQRMLEQYGELVDERAIEAAANEAVHNEARARFMATGLKALSKSELPAAQLVAAARDAAEQTIAAKKVRDVKPAQYLAAETRANKEVLKNAAKDVEKAKRAQRSALLNNRLAKAASSALEEVRKGVDRLNRLQRAAAQDNMRGEYLAQLNALLDRFDLRTGQTLKAIDANRMPLTDWLAAESERLSAVVPDLPDWILNEGNKTHYKDLTMEEFRGVVDAVKQLELLARREEKQYQEIRGMKFAEERQALLQRIWSFHPEAFGPDGEPLGMSPKFVKHFGDTITELGDKFAGEFLNAETIVNLLEGGEFGLAHESLRGRMSKMADWKATRLGEIYKAMAPSFAQYSLLERRDFGRKDIGAPIGMSLTRENALVVALLHGNAEGRERLSNYGWDENTQEAIVGLLDERDMALAERIWSLFDNELWPELKALNDRTRGKSPPKVEAVPVMHKGKFYSGGYFRLKYDTNLDERAHRLDEGAAVKELLGGGLGMSAKTGQGASTERKQNVTMRPRLDLGVFSEAVSETVHDLAYREAVADTMRLLNDKGIQVAIKNAAGTPAYRALVTRVREVAAPPRNPVGFIEKALTIARKNAIVTLMSGVNTALQNFTGFISAAARVHPGRLAKEIALFYSPKMAERYNFAMSQSEYMRNRHNSFERDLQNEVKKMTVNANIMPDTGAWLALMSSVDKGTSVPVWNTAFYDGMAKFENDRARAIDYADHTVRQSQGSGRELDVAQIMSGHGGYGQLKRVFTMFYSYFNSQLGMLVRSGVVNKRLAASNPTMAVANFTKDFMLVFVLPALLTKAIFKGSEDKDPEEWLANYSRALAMYGMAMLPLVRDIGAFAWASFDHSVVNYGFKVTPIQSAGEGVVKGAVSARDILAGEGDDRDLKNLIMGTSYSVGLPGKLISDTVLGTKAVIEGEAPPQAIVFGPPKK